MRVHMHLLQNCWKCK